jgi:hypothetical protein
MLATAAFPLASAEGDEKVCGQTFSALEPQLEKNEKCRMAQVSGMRKEELARLLALSFEKMLQARRSPAAPDEKKKGWKPRGFHAGWRFTASLCLR